MKALVKSHAKAGLWLQDVPEPSIGINDVLIRVLRTGICGTDVHIYNWNDWAQRTIQVPIGDGAEFVGEIVGVGSNVNDFHPANSYRAKATSSAAVVAIAWQAGGIFARTPQELVSIERDALRNSSRCR